MRTHINNIIITCNNAKVIINVFEIVLSFYIVIKTYIFKSSRSDHND